MGVDDRKNSENKNSSGGGDDDGGHINDDEVKLSELKENGSNGLCFLCTYCVVGLCKGKVWPYYSITGHSFIIYTYCVFVD